MVGLPVWCQDIMPWSCGSVIVTEEEVNPTHALFHHVAYKLAILLNFIAGNSGLYRSELGTSKLFAYFCYLLRKKLYHMTFVKELLQRTG